ncbi:MAG: dihydroneopterin aldolase [Chloroflexi bacterium]|nr:dihydroneopterin aldolase [Chloroflexota bacterium]
MNTDVISLKGMIFFAYHGARAEERTLGQRFVVDMDVHADLRAAGQSDSVSDTVNYSELYAVAQDVMQGQPRNLLESLGETIAARVLAEFPRVTRVRVRIAKPSVAIADSILAEAAVTIDRARG